RGEAFSVEAEQLGGGTRRAEAAYGAGVVPVLVVRTAHGGGDPGRNLVAEDHRAQEGLARGASRLRHRERRGDGRRPRVVDAVAIDVVDLDAMRRRAVDERRGTYPGKPAIGEARSAPADLLRKRAFEQGRGRNHRPRKERRVPVDHDALRLMQHLRRHRLTAIALGEPGETLDDVHSSPSPGRCGARSRWANQTSVSARLATRVVE